MEAHPIPQNVTSFQFKLVGDMTLKQFTYLATGATIAYFTFVLLAARFPILAWPIIFISSVTGASFAFLPIADRPLDHWMKAFLKAVYGPTKRVWTRDGHIYTDEPLFKTRLSLFLSSQVGITPSQSLTPMITPSIQHLPPRQVIQPRLDQGQPKEGLPSPEELSDTVKLAREAQNLQQKIIQTEKDLAQIKAASEAPGAQTEVYTEQLNTLLNNLQRLIKETTDVQTKMAQKAPLPHLAMETPKIQVVTPPLRPKLQLILTNFPNVINGITFDLEGNYLPDVVVVVRDKAGLPVRALKTNKLGQFTGATPLPNGTYTVELEKDSFVFDMLKIELNGNILPAIDITAKKILGSS